jgi:hypothetical protein
MLVAIKSKKISKVLTLNNKSERVLINIPLNDWVIIETITNVSSILNYDSITSNGGEVYSSEWRTIPPFGTEGRVKYVRSNNSGGFASAIDVIFSDIKAQSRDAASEKLIDANDVIDKVIQKRESIEIIEYFQKNIEALSNRAAYLKSLKDSGAIDNDSYKRSVYSIGLDFIGNINAKVYDFIGATIREDLSEFNKLSVSRSSDIGSGGRDAGR